MNIFRPKKKKLGISLRGGGALGVAYLGLMQRIEEASIPVEAIVGSSMGAVVASLYSTKLKIDDIELLKSNIMKLISIKSVTHTKLVDSLKLVDYIRENLPLQNIEDSKTKIYIQATNATTNENIIFSKGEVANRLVASCAHVYICDPVEIDGTKYLDGDYSSTYAADYLRKLGCTHVVGVRIHDMFVESKQDPISRVEEILTRYNKSLYSVDLPDNKLDLEISDITPENTHLTDFIAMRKIYDYGYENSAKYVEIIKDLLN